MKSLRTPVVTVTLVLLFPGPRFAAPLDLAVELGGRPAALAGLLSPGPLRSALEGCVADGARPSPLSIGHRGAPLRYPEHTRESYEAAARMGAGVLECDVTFTRDLELVCRHSQCDLHTTTNILRTPLAERCTQPFAPAVLRDDGTVVTPASARCCTSALTLEEFKSLEGRRDVSNPSARTVAEFLRQEPDEGLREAHPLDAGMPAGGTLMTHAESISLFAGLGVEMTPELKAPEVPMPFHGLDQEAYARKLIAEYEAAGIPPERVWPQSFHLEDVLYWIAETPDFGRQAVYLDGRASVAGFDHADPTTWSPDMEELTGMKVRLLAPPQWMLLAAEDGSVVPSLYARQAKEAGLDLIAWTLERPGRLDDGGGWYYQTVADLIRNDGDVFVVLDVLVREVGVVGVFTDWPATVTYYAHCTGR